jgi:hypothetical protein
MFSVFCLFDLPSLERWSEGVREGKIQGYSAPSYVREGSANMNQTWPWVRVEPLGTIFFLPWVLAGAIFAR